MELLNELTPTSPDEVYEYPHQTQGDYPDGVEQGAIPWELRISGIPSSREKLVKTAQGLWQRLPRIREMAERTGKDAAALNET